jgi:hypothetical protein
MWISNQELQTLKDRVLALEIKDTKSDPIPTIRLDYIPFSHGMFFPGEPKYRINITHQDVIMKILQHLGLGLEAIEGTPPSVNLVPKPKK